MKQIRIEAATHATDEVRALISALDRELAAEYSPEQRHGLALDAIFQPHMRFFVATLNGIAAGCGGIALFPGFAEVKRMYVRHDARGQGLAQAILTRLETEAIAAGLSLVRLETGIRQRAAMRLYERAGYRRCPIFGTYAAMQPDAVATSVFFEKSLAAEGA